jgi:hypothetical protein
MKPCLYAHIKDPSSSLEALVAAAHIDGAYKNSYEICSERNKCLAAAGGDRGGVTTAYILRILNRKKGNNPDFCLPIAWYMDGAECYYNLKETFFKKNQPIGNFLQLLVNDELFIIQITWKTKGGESTEDARCFLFKLETNQSCQTEMPAAIDPLTQALDDEDVFAATFNGGSRGQVATVKLPPTTGSTPEEATSGRLWLTLQQQKGDIIGFHRIPTQLLQ